VGIKSEKNGQQNEFIVITNLFHYFLFLSTKNYHLASQIHSPIFTSLFMAESHVNVPDSNISSVLILNTLYSEFSHPVSIPNSISISMSNSNSTKAEQATHQEDCWKNEMKHLIVRGIMGITYAIDIQLNGMVFEVKEELADREGIPPNCIWLSSDGHILNDHRKLSDCGLDDGSIIQAHIRILN
jgi:hypothetical protein